MVEHKRVICCTQPKWRWNMRYFIELAILMALVSYAIVYFPLWGCVIIGLLGVIYASYKE